MRVLLSVTPSAVDCLELVSEMCRVEHQTPATHSLTHSLVTTVFTLWWRLKAADSCTHVGVRGFRSGLASPRRAAGAELGVRSSDVVALYETVPSPWMGVVTRLFLVAELLCTQNTTN